MDRSGDRLISSHSSQIAWRLGWLIAGLVPVIFLSVFFVAPTATLVLRGFHDETGWTLAGLGHVFGAARTWRIVWFTLSSATVATLACLALGIPGAYALYRIRFRGQSALRVVASVPFVLPTVVVGVAFGVLLDGLGSQGSYAAIIAAMVFFNYSVIVRTTGTMWARLDRRIPEAAQALGAGPVRSLLTVTLPALGPAIAAGAALVFLFNSTAFGIVMVLGGSRYSTIETEIWYQTTQLLNLPAAAALSVAQLVVVALTLALTNALQRRSRGAAALHEQRPRAMSWASDGFAVGLTGLVVIGLIAPMAALVVGSLQRRGEFTLANYTDLASSAGLVVPIPILNAAWNSLWIAAVSAAISVTLGSLVSLVATRRPRSAGARWALRGIEGLFLLPLGVSAVTLGFGYLITLNQPPLDLRSSLILVPIAQALVALPLVVRTLMPALMALDVRQLEAARTLGSSPWQVLRRIEFPMLARGLGIAVGFAVATSLGEFGATSFLARPDEPTLPIVIYRLISSPGAHNYQVALAAATVLAGLTATVMALAESARAKGVSAW
ncbi:MAG: ABC transporter permease [Arachnia sp.]